METVFQDFSTKGVKFFYVYKALAHPENNGYVAPFNLEERLMHISEAKRTLGTKIPWVCDSMENDLKHALGDRPNSEFVIDQNGKVIIARSWSNPTQLRSDLEDLVGKVAQPTRVADLEMKKLAPITKPASGVVKRLTLPSQMQPLKMETITTPGVPHYAKLRVESSGQQLYLGFFLDPLYKVHWNNKAAPLEYSIEVPDGLTISPSSGKASPVKVDSDSDPREFLLDVSGNTQGVLKITVKYFACDDAETFCKPVTQTYIVTAERDQDGGSRRSGGAGRSRGGRSRAGARRGSPEGTSRSSEMFDQRDRNGDGELSANEVPPPMRQMLPRADKNGNGSLDRSEFTQMMSRRR
ncbi:EF-hand domain-containing protein [Planctomycetes bacterium K23_9]|uniref:EF hand n=1 Tax=Stieleria marina TaxID=1930275 RepID=A0A517P390_9BACT|nr:EF hand [Planctomycetes bacterium K23_9]